ncbi:MAG: hypothetical protein WAZ12_02055 [Candidatus Absconditicoccaceae bacterium]
MKLVDKKNIKIKYFYGTKMFFILVVFLVVFSFASASDVILSLIINPGQITYGAPSYLGLGQINISEIEQDKQAQFDDYFWVSDLVGSDSGYNTTVVSDGLIGPNGSAVLTGIYLMAGNSNPELLLGTNGNVEINSVFSGDYYSIFNTPVTYIYRGETLNYGKINKYGDKPWIKIVIPAYTQPGMYSGTIYFDI